MVERNLAKVEVAGSSPVVRSIPISGAIGAAVARFLDTEEVTGSNPVSPTSSMTIHVAFPLRGSFAFRSDPHVDPPEPPVMMAP